MSGAGKSQALHTLEDQGYYCIDNLPLELLDIALNTDLLRQNNKVAIGIDVRSGKDCLEKLPEILSHLKRDHKTDIIYLYAGKSVLIKRYDETRRKHPLSDNDTPLRNAILKEYDLLAPVREVADLQLDTSTTDIYELANQIRTRIGADDNQTLSLMFQSFGFKYGTPRDSDYLFDVRCLPNPYWKPELRGHSGLEENVIKWLDAQEPVQQMKQDISQLLSNWIPKFIENQRAYLTVSIGCTGGHHRSVYLTEALSKHFQQQYGDSVIVNHREL